MINEKMYKLGSKRSVIREIFEYAKKRGGGDRRGERIRFFHREPVRPRARLRRRGDFAAS